MNSKKIFYLNSGNILDGENNTFTQALDIPDVSSYTHCTVTQVSLPISYYLVQKGQNQFVLKEGATRTTITIPIGNYNVESFALVVPVLLDNASPNNYVYTMKFPKNYQSANDGKFVFAVTDSVGNPASQQPGFIFNDKNPVSQLFGFNENDDVDIPFTGLQSKNVVDFVPESTIFIHSPLVGSENNDVLTEIYNSSNVPPFGIVTWTNPCPIETAKRLSVAKNKTASFSITDENGLPVYLNGVNLVFSLMFFRDLNIEEKTLEYYKYQVQKDQVVALPQPEP
jgi:hypothetical protein